MRQVKERYKIYDWLQRDYLKSRISPLWSVHVARTGPPLYVQCSLPPGRW